MFPSYTYFFKQFCPLKCTSVRMELLICIVGQWVNLPYSKFKWLNQKEIDKFYVNLIIENSSNGYILEVDFEYPDELHECIMIVH